MMQFIQKTLNLEPKHNSFVKPQLPALPKLSRFNVGGLKSKTDNSSKFKENIRKIVRLRVANALKTRMEKFTTS